jgi:general secretion pathway protein I
MIRGFYRKKNILRLPKSPCGFTLMETLVAMMMLAISLVVILQLFSGGLKSGKMADDYTRAVFHAREKMEEYLLMENFEEGTFEGTLDNKYRWQVDIKFVEPEDQDQDEDQDEDQEEISLVDLVYLDVSVFWPVGGKEKKFQVQTLKVTEKKPDESGLFLNPFKE